MGSHSFSPGDLPGPGIDPMFPELADGLLTTGAPGKSQGQFTTTKEYSFENVPVANFVG